jgi:DNA-binding FadR family transcriptional regulator
MRALVETMKEGETDFDTYRRADIRFHIAMAEAAKSHRLVAAMTEVQGDMSELIALIAHPEEVLAQSNAQHARLIKLLEAGHSTGAAELVRKHLEGTEHILIGLMPSAT